MVPMHGHKTVKALSFHEPDRPGTRSLHWESGAEDARTPDDSRLQGSPNGAKRLEIKIKIKNTLVSGEHQA